MRRDPLFYKLFQQSPTLLFDLIGTRPSNALDYRFDSVAVKEPKFEIDGVFLPPETGESRVIYFCEVQMQRDAMLYERIFAESMLYFYRNRDRFSDWKVVIIYPSRSIEQSNQYPYRSLLNSDQVHRVYLDELGEVRSLPLPVAATVLTIVDEAEAPEVARALLERMEQAEMPERERSNLVDIMTAIMVYKFANLSRREIREMLGLDLSKEPRAIREAKEEGREEGREEVRGQEAIAIITRLLGRSLGQELPEEIRSHLLSLPLSLLEDLSEALLDFTTLADLESWLAQHG